MSFQLTAQNDFVNYAIFDFAETINDELVLIDLLLLFFYVEHISDFFHDTDYASHKAHSTYMVCQVDYNIPTSFNITAL